MFKVTILREGVAPITTHECSTFNSAVEVARKIANTYRDNTLFSESRIVIEEYDCDCPSMREMYHGEEPSGYFQIRVLTPGQAAHVATIQVTSSSKAMHDAVGEFIKENEAKAKKYRVTLTEYRQSKQYGDVVEFGTYTSHDQAKSEAAKQALKYASDLISGVIEPQSDGSYWVKAGVRPSLIASFGIEEIEEHLMKEQEGTSMNNFFDQPASKDIMDYLIDIQKERADLFSKENVRQAYEFFNQIADGKFGEAEKAEKAPEGKFRISRIDSNSSTAIDDVDTFTSAVTRCMLEGADVLKTQRQLHPDQSIEHEVVFDTVGGNSKPSTFYAFKVFSKDKRFETIFIDITGPNQAMYDGVKELLEKNQQRTAAVDAFSQGEYGACVVEPGSGRSPRYAEDRVDSFTEAKLLVRATADDLAGQLAGQYPDHGFEVVERYTIDQDAWTDEPPKPSYRCDVISVSDNIRRCEHVVSMTGPYDGILEGVRALKRAEEVTDQGTSQVIKQQSTTESYRNRLKSLVSEKNASSIIAHLLDDELVNHEDIAMQLIEQAGNDAVQKLLLDLMIEAEDEQI